MNVYADKSQRNKHQSVAHVISQEKGREVSAFPLASNRPADIAQRKLQEMAKDSPQVSQLKRLQLMTNQQANASSRRESSGASSNQDVVQLAATADSLDKADMMWNDTLDLIDFVDRKYVDYDQKLRAQDTGPYHKISERAADGVVEWTDNFRNKSAAYLAELDEAIKRTGGWRNPRIAALGTHKMTEPDMYILRGGGNYGADLGDDTDHVEVKYTDQQTKVGVMGLVYEAVGQLIDRAEVGRNMYRAIIQAPNVKDPYVIKELLKGINGYLPKKSKELADKGNFLKVTIYCRGGKQRISASVLIPSAKKVK